MGKFATYARRGTARQFGFIAAPVAGEFTIGAPLSTSIPVNRVANIPAGADAWAPRAVKVTAPAGAVQLGTVGSGTPLSVGALTTATQYTISVAWFKGTTQVSEWFSLGNATTA